MRSFDIITEADARQHRAGATVELARGGHVTPLARDTLTRAPRHGGAGGIGRSVAAADLAPAADDQARRHRQRSHRRGAEEGDRAAPARARAGGRRCGHGRRIRWTIPTWRRRSPASSPAAKPTPASSSTAPGIGSAIAANKVAGVRAAMCTDETLARYAREHNGANVLTLGSTLLAGPDAALRIVDIWLGTPMTEARYIRRLQNSGAWRNDPRDGSTHRMSNPSGSSAARRDHRRRGDRGAAPRGRSPAQCACHAVLYDCCPDRLRGVLDAGATRLGLHATGGAPGRVAGMIDHTLLKPDATRAEIEKLCREAAEFDFATVCVNPAWVALAARAAARNAASASARWSAFRWAPPPPTSSTTRPGARSSTAPPRSTW